jgi:hypothetical protein
MAEFAGGVSYTPFFTEAMGGMADALKGRREKALDKQKNELARSAWMGEPNAMGELMTMDPQMAMEVDESKMQREEKTQQDTMAKDTAFQEESQSILEQIGTFNDYAGAQEFGQRMKNYLTEKYPERTAAKGDGPEFTEQNFNEIKTIVGGLGKGFQTVGDGYQVAHPVTGEPATAVIVQDENGVQYEKLLGGRDGVSLTRLSQYDVDLKRKLAESQATGKTEGQSTEQRAQTAIDAGTAASLRLPKINRSLALLDKVETSGLKADLNRLAQYVGYEGDETPELAELQGLLGEQFLETLKFFTGSKSEGEMRVAQTLATSLGKNTEANKRILRSMQRILARDIDLARTAAQQRGDTLALEMLETFDPYAAAPDEVEALPEAAASSKKPAPPKALEKLKANPDMIDYFVEEYGYRPEGY